MSRPSPRETGSFVITVAVMAAAGVLLGPFFVFAAIVPLAAGGALDDWGMVYGALVGALVGAGTCVATF